MGDSLPCTVLCDLSVMVRIMINLHTNIISLANTNYSIYFKMPPAKRIASYSVWDVIDGIQNGERDFEMESDYTDL